MSFNFINNELIIYHDGITAETLSLYQHTNIIPAFSLYEEGGQIEVIKYEYKIITNTVK